MRELFQPLPNTDTDVPLVIYPNALDARIKKTTGSAQYETHCFEILCHLFPDDFVIGPHVIDWLLGGDSGYSNLVRPDGLVFTVSEETPILTHIIEVKSGKSLDLTRKVQGFSVLLKRLRNYATFLPHRMQECLGDYLTVPSHFIIPSDEHIAVVFMSQHYDALSYSPTTIFPFRAINFLKIPFEQ